MRIKIGHQWFECKPGQPIMVELTDGDKRNIANMHPDATRYAVFEDDDGWSNEQKFAWMDEGRNGSMKPIADPGTSLAEAFAAAEKAFPNHYWMFGKGKTRPDEPLFGFALFDMHDANEPVACGEDDDPVEAVNHALANFETKGEARADGQPRRCETNFVGAAGECLACDAEQGVACQKDRA